MCNNTGGSFQCSSKLRQRDAAILLNQLFQKRLMSRQLPMAWRTALNIWLGRTRIPAACAANARL